MGHPATMDVCTRTRRLSYGHVHVQAGAKEIRFEDFFDDIKEDFDEVEAPR